MGLYNMYDIHSSEWSSQMKSDLEAAMKESNNLNFPGSGISQEQATRIWQIRRTNSFSRGVCLKMSRFNHSCYANTGHFWNTAAETRDFTPKLKIYGDDIELLEELRLLGVVITSDLKWNKNTEFTTKRGYSKLWILRRLKQNGANVKEICDIYQKHVRSILEYSAVVWHAGLTQVDITNLERVQKAAFSIILGKEYICYENALNKLGMKRLDDKRLL